MKKKQKNTMNEIKNCFPTKYAIIAKNKASKIDIMMLKVTYVLLTNPLAFTEATTSPHSTRFLTTL